MTKIKNKWIFLFIFIFLLVGIFAWRYYNLIILLEIPEKYSNIQDFAVSKDGNRLAYIVREKGSEEFVVFDRKEQPRYDKITQLGWSEDGSRISYIGEKNSQSYVIIGDKKFGPYAGISSFLFDSKKERFACVVQKDNKLQAVIDGIAGDYYAWIDSPVFSPNGKTVAYRARTNKDGEYDILVVEGKVKKFENIMPLVFSPDGKNLAYSIRNSNGNSQLMINDKAVGKSYKSTISYYFFSPDSKDIAYAVYDGGKEFVVYGDKIGDNYEGINDLKWIADGSGVVYRATKKNGSEVEDYIVENSKSFNSEKGPYDYVFGGGEIYPSHDGATMAFWSKIDDKQFFIVGENKYGGEEVASNVLFGKTGRVDEGVYFVKKEEKYVAMRFGKDGVQEGKFYDKIFSNSVISDDGKHYAYVAEDAGKFFVVLDKKEYGPFNWAGNLSFSKSDLRKERLIYIAKTNGKYEFTRRVLN